MNAKEIRSKKRALIKVSRKLKNKFVGIDSIIDQVIENITEGDVVISVDLTTRQLVEKSVLGLVEVIHNDIVYLKIALLAE